MNVLTEKACRMFGVPPERFHEYPREHWDRLQEFVGPFATGRRDPRDQFALGEDVWDAWQYAQVPRRGDAVFYRFRFGGLRSFLRPYVKWYCYEVLILGRGPLSRSASRLPYRLRRADDWIVASGIRHLAEIEAPSVFERLWASLLDPAEHAEPPPRRAVLCQEATRAFWERLRLEFGAPRAVPPTARHARRSPREIGLDTSRVIPPAVTRQLVNRLALHREGAEVLNPYDHLRLCVLVLAICVGRRIDEVLAAPRGTGADGPLWRYPSRSGRSGDLWFVFEPNKHGPSDRVFISEQWESLASYCVASLLAYSDAVRDMAPEGERHLLILISGVNRTAEGYAAASSAERAAARPRRRWAKRAAKALSYHGLYSWLNDKHDRARPDGLRPGVLRRWLVTSDGSADPTRVYRMRTHHARHTRHTALMADHRVSRLAAQRDLNHSFAEMQIAYQHQLQEQNTSLLERVERGELIGRGAQWLRTLLAQQEPGSDRARELFLRDHAAVQFIRVPGGYCVLPQGPLACEEHLRCLDAEELGCRWLATDPADPEVLREVDAQIDRTLAAARTSAQPAAAGKEAELARRASAVRAAALAAAPEEIRARLRERADLMRAGGGDT